MGDLPAQIAWLLGCVAAIGFAAHFPIEQRRNAIVLAVAVLANWAYVQWTYSDAAVAMLGQAVLLKTWGAADFAVGVVAVTQIERTWLNISVLVGVVAQEVSHDWYNYGIVSAETYLGQLDIILGMILLLFVIGGAKGAADGIYRFVTGGRFLRWSPRQAVARTKWRG